jgi:hypothetical protein
MGTMLFLDLVSPGVHVTCEYPELDGIRVFHRAVVDNSTFSRIFKRQWGNLAILSSIFIHAVAQVQMSLVENLPKNCKKLSCFLQKNTWIQPFPHPTRLSPYQFVRISYIVGLSVISLNLLGVIVKNSSAKPKNMTRIRLVNQV